MRMSRSTSPSSILETGMPVHLETTWAMSSSSTSSLSIRPLAWSAARSAAALSISFWTSMSLP